MAKSLLIVESPAKSRTIAKYLGKNFIIRSSMGHIIDLPEKELGIDLKDNFKPKYVPIRGKGKTIKDLRDASKNKECVYLAPDPDREGEAIAWHIQSIIDKDVPVKRVSFHEITKAAVLRAVDAPRQIDQKLVNAQQARRILDRMVGYLVSPILWRALYRGLSAGRVQSVALRVICERNKEIEDFNSKEYWTLDAGLATPSNAEFTARLTKIKKKKAEISDKENIDAIIKDISGKDFLVKSVTKKERMRQPSPPFITSTLQQEVARRLYFSAAKTMMVAQQLYEGMEVADETIGLITYMRTDSTRVSEEAKKAASDWILSKYGASFLPKKPKKYKVSKNAQDAHEAIRPTQISEEFSPEKIKSYLSNDQYRLYELIWKRFIASQMSNAVYDSTAVDINVEEYVFHTNGVIEKFPGFKKEYAEKTEESEVDQNNKKLPEMQNGDKLNFKEWLPEQHFTQPPPAFSEATLVRELESKGIGRPSTYAQIIETLKRRKYVQMDKRRFSPSDIGKTVNTILVKEFSAFFNVEFTAQMEQKLDKVESGDVEWISVLRDFYDSFSKTLSVVNGEIADLKKILSESTDEKCEKCDSPMIIKWGRHGKFMACSAYPKCSNTKPIGQEAEELMQSNEKCPKCGAPLKVKFGRTGRFLGCSAYPECKFAKPISIGIKCPKPECKGDVTQRRSKKGRSFYGCTEYPNCDFVSWDKPINKTCPACENNYMVEKTSKAKGDYLYCPKCKNSIQKS